MSRVAASRCAASASTRAHRRSESIRLTSVWTGATCEIPLDHGRQIGRSWGWAGPGVSRRSAALAYGKRECDGSDGWAVTRRWTASGDCTMHLQRERAGPRGQRPRRPRGHRPPRGRGERPERPIWCQGWRSSRIDFQCQISIQRVACRSSRFPGPRSPHTLVRVHAIRVQSGPFRSPAPASLIRYKGSSIWVTSLELIPLSMLVTSVVVTTETTSDPSGSKPRCVSWIPRRSCNCRRRCFAPCSVVADPAPRAAR